MKKTTGNNAWQLFFGRLVFWLDIALACLAASIVFKIFFMLYNFSLYKDCSFVECLSVCIQGIRVDTSVAAYFSVIPGLLVALSYFLSQKATKIAFRVYFIFVSLVIVAINVGNIALYSFWGFPLDITPFYYLATPKEAFASVSIPLIICGFASIFFHFVFIGYLISYLQKQEVRLTHRETSKEYVFHFSS